MKKKILILTAVITTICIRCTNMAPETPSDNQETGGCSPQFPNMNITYNNYVKKIVNQYCIVCHNGGNSPGPGNFGTYNGIRPYVDFFSTRVIPDQADMPQGNAPLPKAIRDSLNVWIKNCAPEN